MSLNTEVFTAWGNAVQGIFITWGNEAATNGAITQTTTELSIKLDLRLYGLGTLLSTEAAVTSDFLNVYFLI